MKIISALALACLASATASAQLAPPALNVHSSGIKQLEFTWSPVPDATSYELWFKANSGAAWSLSGTTTDTRRRISASVHLLDWQQARYQVMACNGTECVGSNIRSVNSLRTAAMGYLTPYCCSPHHYFGGSTALSADGTALAVVAGVNIGARVDTAVIYIYRKAVGGGQGWMREARLVPDVVQDSTAQPFSGDQITISGDGNTVAFGSWSENTYKPTVQGRGAVYIWHRDGTTWSQVQRLAGTSPPTGNWQPGDHLGYVVKLDDAGKRLAVSHEWYNDGGVYRHEVGTVDIYQRDGSGPFLFSPYIQVRTPLMGGRPAQCEAMALSGNGKTLIRACRAVYNSSDKLVWIADLGSANASRTFTVPGGTLNGIDVSFDQSEILVQDGLKAHAYRRDGTNWRWLADGDLDGLAGEPNGAKRSIALSRDGKIAVMGNPSNDTPGRGPVFPPYGTDGAPTGAAMVFERKSTGWTVRRLVRPNSENAEWFGHSVALGDNGRILAVGAPYDPSASEGINGDPDDNSAFERGSVWLY